MSRLSIRLLVLLAGTAFTATACAAREDQVDVPEDSAARGEYLVNLLGCGRCHTQGYLLGGDAAGPHLAGSRVGIAYTDSDEGITPGLVFAPNLTPDEETGLGTWSRRDIVRALTTGVGNDGHQRLPVMPWPNYAALTREDLRAIADYLQSLPAVTRRIPATTGPGAPAEHPYVRFGIFVFTPFDDEEAPQEPRQTAPPL